MKDDDDVKVFLLLKKNISKIQDQPLFCAIGQISQYQK